jgi:ATP-dependent DNA ligase I
VSLLLRDLADASAAVAATAARLGKVALLAEVLARAPADEAAAAVAFLSGELRQRQIGVGWATLREVPPPAGSPSLRVGETDALFEQVGKQAGAGSQAARRDLLAGLFARATAPEQTFLRQLLVGELRQGALAGVMVDAVAKAAGVPLKDVRRAVMLRGDLGAVAAAALAGGAPALAGFRLEVGRPVLPMLAQPADGVDAALARTGFPAAVEWKLDGARIQVHRDGADVAVYTRSLDDITARVPEVVEAALALPLTAVVLDGEAIALRPDGRPEPFQVTASRFGSKGDPAGLRAATPLSPVLFDLLHLDGADLLDEPGAARQEALASVVPEALRVPRVLTDSVAGGSAAFTAALEHGHEGVVVKSLLTPYEAGRRGAGWLKVKPRHTLDLVVLAVERGHGRRTGWLSNLHLGARDPAGGFVMLGKTFKGLTDAMLRWQTERLGALAVDDTGWVVRVRPELVVEVAFDGVQTSPRYPGGVALRFARVLRYREDKTAAEADTIDAVRAIHSG